MDYREDLGTAEALGTLGSGMAAQIPGGIAGLVDYFRQVGHARALGKKDPLDRARESAAKTVGDVSEAFTYAPRTRQGQERLGQIGEGIERAGELAMKIPGAPAAREGWEKFTATAPLLGATAITAAELLGPGKAKPKVSAADAAIAARAKAKILRDMEPGQMAALERQRIANYTAHPDEMNRPAVAEFFSEARKNPSMFQYGPEPPADVRGIEGMARHFGRQADEDIAVDYSMPKPNRLYGPRAEEMLPDSENMSLHLPKRGSGMMVSDYGGGNPTINSEHVGKGGGGALLYQTILADASRGGYKIMPDDLTADNSLRLLSNTGSNYARMGVNPRDVTGTDSGRATPAKRFAEGPEILRAEAEEAKVRMEKFGVDPDRVRFDGDQFRLDDRPVNPDQLLPALRWDSQKIKWSSVGQKTMMRMAFFDWLRGASVADAQGVAKNWKKWGPLFGAAGAAALTEKIGKDQDDLGT